MKRLNDLTTDRRSFTAGIAIIAMLVLVLISSYYLAFEADHRIHCDEDECPVCDCIQICEGILHDMSDGTTIPVFTVLPIIAAAFLLSFFKCNEIFGTLVSKKIRLNN